MRRVAPSAMSREMALCWLFVDLFADTIHLKRHFESADPPLRRVAGELPAAGASLEHFAAEAARSLYRHTLLTAPLFVGLAARFPRRTADIAAVFRLWCPAADTPATLLVRAGPRRRDPSAAPDASGPRRQS